MNEAATQYATQGRIFLAQANEEIAKGDLLQASEKGWGAAAQVMKAAAAERGWRHGQHRQLFDVAERLAEELGDEELRDRFFIASDLHANFYEGFLRSGDVEFSLRRVTSLVDQVEQALANGDP